MSGFKQSLTFPPKKEIKIRCVPRARFKLAILTAADFKSAGYVSSPIVAYITKNTSKPSFTDIGGEKYFL